ncbi:DNA mismatch repair endonuclease MutL [Candidatus Stoquefichus massiliensis]|uniref:DNA mismatch repair endonuclease MutL n=1 Tax=Candidatus Stoquefichus massiliensis TaxID=1470350 RepID=UPI0004898A05|nr:DNA mismatch repair endonuclease MutL [Candidatus Stoquefichus massiliensis]
MAKIRQLDDILSNKIAAGEVVERPSSVVKELVENSIDASANRIDIFIEDGGLQMIKVVDNGEGMEKEDARLCFSRHATSKIKDDHDLFNIMTLGFRGEAIPSIASVSGFDLRTSSGDQGTFITYEFGKYKKEGTCDLPRGTQITVTKLFQNVPARLKYLKSVNSEFAAIHQYIERIALAYPQIAIRLYHNEKLIFQTNGKGQLLEVIASMYGISTAKNMIPIQFENDEFQIDGYMSKIDTSRASKTNIITLVNHRYVKNIMSIDAINNAYRRYLADNRFPIAVINIEVDPYLVDVNVHPSKLEVRFSKEYELRELIYNGVSDALAQIDLTYQAKNKTTERETFKPELDQITFDLHSEPVVTQSIHTEPTVTKPIQAEVVKETSTSYQTAESLQQQTVVKSEPLHIEQRPIKEKIYAKTQIHGTYLVGENEKGMYLLDQHAAQERINYEYYKSKFEKLDLTMQPLIVPLQLEYPMSEFLILEERKSMLKEVGIELEVFGEHGYIVRSLPLWMKKIDENIFVDTMVQEVLHKNNLDVVGLQEHAIATLSCKASLKANTYLSPSDMQTIFDNLMRCENPYVCPHGRPTILFYSDYELEKLFKRVV